jgi:hypothetical protein
MLSTPMVAWENQECCHETLSELDENERDEVCAWFANAVSAVCCCADLVGHIHGPCAGRAEAAGVERGDVSPDKLFTLPCGNVRPPLSLPI